MLGSDPSALGPGLRIERWLVGGLVALVVAGHGFTGGAYDIVVRGEIGIVIWWALLAGAITGVLPRSRPSLRAYLALAALALFGGVTAASLAWTSSTERTTIELARVVGYLGVLALILSSVRRETVEAAAYGLTVGLGAVVLAACVSRLAPTVVDDTVAGAFSIARLSYPLNYWNGVAAWAAMTCALSVGITSWAGGARVASAFLGLTPVAITAGYLTYSRAGLIGIPLGLIAVIILSRRRLATAISALVAIVTSLPVVLAIRARPEIADGTGAHGAWLVAGSLGAAVLICIAVGVVSRRIPPICAPRRSIGLGAAAIAAIAAAALAIVVLPGAVERGWESFSRPAPQVQQGTSAGRVAPDARIGTLSGNRINEWRSALAAGRSEPLRGIGAGTFEYWWNAEARDAEFVRDAHSLYFETFAELGVIGCAALAALLVALVACLLPLGPRRKAINAPAAALAATFVTYLFHAGVDWMWELSAVTIAALTVVGVSAAGSSGDKGGGSVVLRSMAAVSALLATAVLLPPTVSLSNVRKSQSAVRQGDIETARARANDAVAAAPWAASPYVQRALVSEASSELDEAHADLSRAASRDHRDWRIPLIQARVLAEAGKPRQALRSYARAKRLRPHAEPFR